MGFSCGDHFIDEKEGQFPLIDESSSGSATKERQSQSQRQRQRRSVIMEVQQQGFVEKNTDFFPVEHPMEPTDEDRPVKCPMPESSVINDGGMHEKRFAESLRKRAEVSAATADGERTAAMDTEPPARGVRKRHHTLTHAGGDLVMTPLMRMPPLPSQNITIFEMLQQLDKFEP